MSKFTILVDQETQEKINNPEKYFPPEACAEIKYFIQILERDGQLTKTDFYDINTNKISGVAVNLFYRVNFTKNQVLIIDIKVKSTDILKQRFQINDDYNDQDVLDKIPQYDQPKKIIKAIILIDKGVKDSYNLGCELGHKAKKEKDIARHGQYAMQALEQLDLITRIKIEKVRKLEPKLTEKGKLIVNAPNEDLRCRLLIEAMLKYHPVWKILVAVSKNEDQPHNNMILNDELVKNLIFPKELHGADTTNRRSQTLKNWIKWICKFSGIPIYVNEHSVQLPIPMLFAESTINEDEC